MPNASKIMISIQQVGKTYNKGKVQALSNINLEVAKGELFGLIGPDGAGKTTLFRILATLLQPDAGTATVNGNDVVRDYKAIRSTIGYMPGKFSLYQDLTILENLEFYAAVFGTTIAENYEQIKPIYSQIEPFKHRRAGQLSGGMKQKLALSCALVHKPELLLLDEPTTGVDPVSRQEFWEMLQLLKESGLTIVVSTPYMDEARLCDRIALIQKGNILSINTPQGITDSYAENLYAVRSDEMYRLINDLRTLTGVSTCYAFGEYAHVAEHTAIGLKKEDIQAFLLKKEHKNIEINRTRATIEDCFIALMKE
jgi:ABC-type multidrug transport system ATPase subunit